LALNPGEHVDEMQRIYGPGRSMVPGTDFAIRVIHGSWRYHKITAARLHDDLAGLAAKLARPSWLASWARTDRSPPPAPMDAPRHRPGKPGRPRAHHQPPPTRQRTPQPTPPAVNPSTRGLDSGTSERKFRERPVKVALLVQLNDHAAADEHFTQKAGE
jgi:hypothetical protein